MNIYEMSDKFKISLSKLRSMDKAHCLRLDSAENDRAAEIRTSIRKNGYATVEQLLYLIENPGFLIDLGRFADLARKQIEKLGDVKGDEVSPTITAYIDEASRGDAAALAILRGWLQEVLPGRAVTHAWIACRLLIGMNDNLRKVNIKRIPMALKNLRASPEFANWWKTEKTGPYTQTFYMKAKLPLDL